MVSASYTEVGTRHIRYVKYLQAYITVQVFICIQVFQYSLYSMTTNIFKQINMVMVPLFQCQYNLYRALERFCTYQGTYTTLERHKGGVIHFNTRLPIHKKCFAVRYKNTKSVYPKRNTPLHPWRHMFIFNIYRTRHYLSVRPNLISH